MTSHYTRGSVTSLHDVGGGLGRLLGHFLLGSHNFVATALGSCVREREMDVKSTWLPTWHQMNHVSWSLGLFSKTTS